jgi:hypothetical protein
MMMLAGGGGGTAQEIYYIFFFKVKSCEEISHLTDDFFLQARRS